MNEPHNIVCPRAHRTHRVFIATTSLHHDERQTPNVGDTLPDDGNPFSDEPQSIRSYTTIASTQHYACIVNVATAARYHVPSCTPPLHVDNLLISPHTLSTFLYFISNPVSLPLSQTLIFVFYLKPYLSPLSNPHFCTLSQTLSLSPSTVAAKDVATMPWPHSSGYDAYLKPSPSLSLSHSTVAAKDVATMPLRRCRGCTGSGYDTVAALTWLQ